MSVVWVTFTMKTNKKVDHTSVFHLVELRLNFSDSHTFVSLIIKHRYCLEIANAAVVTTRFFYLEQNMACFQYVSMERNENYHGNCNFVCFFKVTAAVLCIYVVRALVILFLHGKTLGYLG